MKRLAAALAATVLASGCGDDDRCTGTVTVEWPDFLQSNGAVTSSCATAGIDTVDVFLDGQPVDRRFDCRDGGATIVGVSSGPILFTVEGLGSDGFIRYRAELTVDSGCADVLVQTQPAAGTANLLYSAAGGCSRPPCFLFFSVFDVVANTVTAAVTRGSPADQQRTFPYPDDVAFELPAGPHRVEWMELVSSEGLALEASSCTPVDFDVVGGSTPSAPSFTPEIPLAAGGPACE